VLEGRPAPTIDDLPIDNSFDTIAARQTRAGTGTDVAPAVILMADHDQRFKSLLKAFFAEFFETFFRDWAYSTWPASTSSERHSPRSCEYRTRGERRCMPKHYCG
jgi:hypothetical protein